MSPHRISIYIFFAALPVAVIGGIVAKLMGYGP